MNVLQLVPIENSARGAAKTPQAAVSFDEFWQLYPRKVGKRDAQKAWARLTPAEQQAAVEAIPQHVTLWRRSNIERQYVPHPASWLNGARWEDEIDMPVERDKRGAVTQQAPRPENSGQRSPDAGAWASSWAGMDAKARELGIGIARPGESTEQYRSRIFQALHERDRAARYG